MSLDNKTDDDIRRILGTVETIALVGASNNPDRPSYRVLGFLKQRGYRVFPINPGLAGKEIHGLTVHARLADVPEPIDMVDVFRNADAVGPVVDEAIDLRPRPRVVWMQLGIWNHDAAERATGAGIETVMDRCPAIEIPRLGL